MILKLEPEFIALVKRLSQEFDPMAKGLRAHEARQRLATYIGEARVLYDKLMCSGYGK
jgi:hypothetical protein